MKEIKKYDYIDNEFYESIKIIITTARTKVYRNIQSEWF